MKQSRFQNPGNKVHFCEGHTPPSPYILSGSSRTISSSRGKIRKEDAMYISSCLEPGLTRWGSHITEESRKTPPEVMTIQWQETADGGLRLNGSVNPGTRDGVIIKTGKKSLNPTHYLYRRLFPHPRHNSCHGHLMFARLWLLAMNTAHDLALSLRACRKPVINIFSNHPYSCRHHKPES